MRRIFSVVFSIVIFCSKAVSQNPLPDFSAEDFGNDKVRISWINPFNENCIQLSVQSSLDNKVFKTIFSTESPQLPQNGFIYAVPFKAKFYYRISYILNGNAFFFTPAKSPGIASVGQIQGEEQKMQGGDATRVITIRNKEDSVIAIIPYTDFRRFRDSVLANTQDTLFIVSQDNVILRPYDPTNYYRPSTYVVSNRDGFVELKLPEANNKTYKIVFFDGDGKKLFTINRVSDTDLVIDKANFMHAGWFIFELYENDKLKERNKILLQKDF